MDMPNFNFDDLLAEWKRQQKLFKDAGESNFPEIEKYHADKERKENWQFWIPTIIALIALVISAISLWLQARGK